MNVIKVVAAAGLTLALGLGTVLAPVAASASSASKPVVYSTGWWNPRVAPRAIYVGQGSAPFVAGLHWSHWSKVTASAHGREHYQIPGCTKPSYQCPYSSRRARVYLHRVRSHQGTRYFSRMRWTVSGARINWELHRGYWH